MAAPATVTVHALLPLSLLEAVRAVDRPVDDHEAEFVFELRNKRLGLSETVQAQIRRYEDAAERSRRLAADEVEALARLIGRRPDAEAIFRAAGAWLAAHAYATLSGTARRAARTLPGLLARPVALRQLRRIARRYLGGRVTREGSAIVLAVSEPVTLDVAPRGAGCAYYEASFAELLRLLAAQGGVVEHVRCRSRAEGGCEWRAEWRR
jgi:hypothetical protein